MKKMVALIIVVCLMFPITQISAEVKAEIKNPSFENGKNYWDIFAIGREPSELEVSEIESVEGDKSAKINPGEKGVTGISQTLSVSEMGNVNISVWTKTLGESWLEVVQLKNDKPVGEYLFLQSPHARKNGDWEKN